MSGGHWDYSSHRIEEMLAAIGSDPSASEKWPAICQLFAALGPVLARCEHVMDFDLSADASVSAGWERARLAEILNVVLKSMPDEWFPRGKWATIQALEERAETKV